MKRFDAVGRFPLLVDSGIIAGITMKLSVAVMVVQSILVTFPL